MDTIQKEVFNRTKKELIIFLRRIGAGYITLSGVTLLDFDSGRTYYTEVLKKYTIREEKIKAAKTYLGIVELTREDEEKLLGFELLFKFCYEKDV